MSGLTRVAPRESRRSLTRKTTAECGDRKWARRRDRETGTDSPSNPRSPHCSRRALKLGGHGASCATRKILGPKPLVNLGRGSQVDRTVDHDRAAASGEDLPTRQMQRRHTFLLLDHLGQGDLRERKDYAADT